MNKLLLLLLLFLLILLLLLLLLLLLFLFLFDHPFQVYYKVRLNKQPIVLSGYHPRPGYQTVFSHANFSFLRFELTYV